MGTSACPDRRKLQAFSVGKLPSGEWQSIAAHVEECDDCLGRLDQGDHHDALVARLRELPEQAATVDPDGESDDPSWEHAVITAQSQATQLVADAGGELARRLELGPVFLDRFELQAELGVGSFGYVFRAWDPRLERLVALKVQRAGSFASRDEVQRFLREARSAAPLKHPAIVSLYETGQTADGVGFLVCEYIAGPTLEARLKSSPLSAFEAADIAGELASALDYAHVQGVIHRDIKPSNVILDTRQQPHLMDFGLAKQTSSQDTMTSDGRLLGTPAYMSPEQARGTPHEVDARSDVYSLGVVLYEMLTGRRPFEGDRQQILASVIEEEPPAPRSIRPAIPRDLEVICLKAMNKSAGRRFPTAGDFAQDIERFRQGRPILARPLGYAERSWQWCRRYPLAVSALVAVLVGSAAGLAYLSRLSDHFVQQTALTSARLETKMLDEAWRFYSEEIEDIDPQKTNIRITEKYRTEHPSLPLPASFAIDLAERISRKSPGMEIRVYSRYPWPGRKSGGPQDDFDVRALEWLESQSRLGKEPAAEYARFVTDGGQRKLLFYTARHMEQSCLGCHNHPQGESPKRDWQLGDVVGVLKIVRPLHLESESTRQGLRGAFVWMGTVAALLVLASVAVSIASERRRKAATS